MGTHCFFHPLRIFTVLMFFGKYHRGTTQVGALDIDNPTGRFSRFAELADTTQTDLHHNCFLNTGQSASRCALWTHLGLLKMPITKRCDGRLRSTLRSLQHMTFN